MTHWLIIALITLGTVTAVNVGNAFVTNEIQIIENEIMKWVFNEGVSIEESHYLEICNNLDLTSDECYNDCLDYLFPLTLLDTVSEDINGTNDTDFYEARHQLLKVFNWYQMSGGPIGQFSVGNPSMCDYNDGTYCATPLQITGNDDYVPPLILQTHGCCVPGSCVGEDALKILRANDWCYKSYVSLFESIKSRIDSELIEEYGIEFELFDICEPLERDYSSVGFWIMSIICAIFVLCTLVSSIIAIFSEHKSFFVSSFSIQDSWQVFTNRRALEKSQFNFFDGLRFLSIMLIVAGHGIMLTLTGVTSNAVVMNFAMTPASIMSNVKEYYPYWVTQLLWHMILWLSIFSVDTFFYLSGFLSTFGLLNRLDQYDWHQSIKSAKLMWIPFSYLSRYLRLIPLVIFVVFFQLYIADQLWYGYYVTSRTDNYEVCVNEWYEILFLYDNFTAFTKRRSANMGCVNVIWYVCCDFQMFLLLPWVVLLFKWKEICGLVGAIALVLICIICRIYYAVHFHLIANSYVEAYPQAHSDEWEDAPADIYRRPWARWAPYFMGAFTMLLISKLSQSNFKIKSNFVYSSLMSVSLFIICSLIFWSYSDVKDGLSLNQRWSRTQNEAFFGLSLAAWGVALSVMTFAFYFRDASSMKCSLIHTLLSIEIFQPLSKLTYSTYLIHAIVFTLYFNGLDLPNYAQNETEIVWLLGMSVIIVMISFVLWFTVEKPMGNLIKACLKKIEAKNVYRKVSIDGNDTSQQSSEDEQMPIQYL